MTEPIRPGMHVRDVRGSRLGAVGAVAKDRLRLDTDSGAGVWLSLEAVLNAGFGTVTLICDGSALSEHEVPPPVPG